MISADLVHRIKVVHCIPWIKSVLSNAKCSLGFEPISMKHEAGSQPPVLRLFIHELCVNWVLYFDTFQKNNKKSVENNDAVAIIKILPTSTCFACSCWAAYSAFNKFMFSSHDWLLGCFVFLKDLKTFVWSFKLVNKAINNKLFWFLLKKTLSVGGGGPC